MKPTKRLAGPCAHCGRTIEYHAHLVGTSAACPFCGQVTELSLAPPPQEPPLPRRAIVFTAITVVILLVGLAACFLALRWAQNHAGGTRSRGTAVPAQQ